MYSNVYETSLPILNRILFTQYSLHRSTSKITIKEVSRSPFIFIVKVSFNGIHLP